MCVWHSSIYPFDSTAAYLILNQPLNIKFSLLSFLLHFPPNTEEIFAQKEAEEQEKLQRAAARKARLAEMSSIVHVNPWFADGEDFTRKSSRLSGVARPAYSDIDGENVSY